MSSSGGGDGDGDMDIDVDADVDSDSDGDTDSDTCGAGATRCGPLCYPDCPLGQERDPDFCNCIDGGSDADSDTDGDTDADTDTWTGGMIEFDVNVHTAHPYANSWSQNWTVDPPGATASSIELYITGFDLEPCCDHLFIYDRVGGTLLDQFEGYGLGAFTAGPYDESTLYLSFTTDSSVVAQGFDIDTGGYTP